MQIGILAVVGLAMLACAGDEAHLQEQAYDSESNVEDVGLLRWKQQSIQFWNTSPGESAPSILMVRQGPPSGGDILADLEREAGMMVTPAELWTAISGSADLPEVLKLDHLLSTEREGRTSEYQNLDANSITAEKAVPIDLALQHAIFPFQDNQHCWNSRKQFAVQAGLRIGHPDSYACSDAAPETRPDSVFVRFAPVILTTACPTFHNSTGALRVGVSNNTALTSADRYIEQTCFDGGAGWQCLNTLSFLPGHFITSDLVSSPLPHRLALGVNVTTARDTILTYAAARKLSKAPRSSTDGFCL